MLQDRPALMHKILQLLPEKYRNILVLRFLEDKDYQEISEILKKPMGTVSILLNRAKKHFKKYAQKQLPDLS